MVIILGAHFIGIGVDLLLRGYGRTGPRDWFRAFVYKICGFVSPIFNSYPLTPLSNVASWITRIF
jgi:hypothetical protein